MKSFAKLFVAGMLVFSGFTAAVAAESDLKTIQKSMADRLKSVNELKKSGKVGEDNKGFLAVMGDEKKAEKTTKELVEAENADRLKVYEEIAAKQKVSVDNTGIARAKKIAELAKEGEWLQNSDDEWYQKTADKKK